MSFEFFIKLRRWGPLTILMAICCTPNYNLNSHISYQLLYILSNIPVDVCPSCCMLCACVFLNGHTICHWVNCRTCTGPTHKLLLYLWPVNYDWKGPLYSFFFLHDMSLSFKETQPCCDLHKTYMRHLLLRYPTCLPSSWASCFCFNIHSSQLKFVSCQCCACVHSSGIYPIEWGDPVCLLFLEQ